MAQKIAKEFYLLKFFLSFHTRVALKRVKLLRYLLNGVIHFSSSRISLLKVLLIVNSSVLRRVELGREDY